MSPRARTPTDVETQVLTQSRRRCCLCYGLDADLSAKEGQIAHVDRNPENSALSNLAWLCHKHHAAYDVRSSQCKCMTPGELRTYRADLYTVLEANRAVQSKTLGPSDNVARRDAADPLGALVMRVIGNGNLTAGRDLNYLPRIIRKNVLVPGPHCIAEDQAHRIQQVVRELAERDMQPDGKPPYGKWYGRLNRRFRVASYRMIPAEKGEEAIAWLQRQRAILKPRLRRRDNPGWRKDNYRGIFARAKQLGLSKDDLHRIATERLGMDKPVTSLKELGERNLEKLYNIIFSMSP